MERFKYGIRDADRTVTIVSREEAFASSDGVRQWQDDSDREWSWHPVLTNFVDTGLTAKDFLGQEVTLYSYFAGINSPSTLRPFQVIKITQHKIKGVDLCSGRITVKDHTAICVINPEIVEEF